MARIELTRERVLEFNERWDESDRRQISQFLDGNGQALAFKDEVADRRPELEAVIATIPQRLVSMNTTPSRGQVTGRDADGKPLFYIRPGALDLQLETGVEAILHFTTVGWSGPRQGHDDRPVAVCPVHHLALSSSGVCDECA